MQFVEGEQKNHENNIRNGKEWKTLSLCMLKCKNTVFIVYRVAIPFFFDKAVELLY